MIDRRNVLAYLMVLCGILFFLFLSGDYFYTDLTFSKKSGFYEEPFELKLYAPLGTSIYYTMDGSEPDENAIKYTEPIMIGDATKNDNVYSMRTDVTAGFLTEEIAAYSTSYPDPNYAVPDYNVDKCTVVRAIYIDADGNAGKVKTESYFVGYNHKLGYNGVNIISVVSDPDDLFSHETGIYVLGQAYDEYAIGKREFLNTDPYWNWWEANYRQRGAEWERRASIQFFNDKRELLVNQDCGIRIQGGGSRGLLPKSINIYAREEYSEEGGRFYSDLFGTGYMADTITLFSGGDDAKSKIRDKLTADLVRNRNFVTMNFEPCVMFLDGEYWGIYWLTEKSDDVSLGYYYNVDKDNVVMIKSVKQALAEGEKSDYTLYADMMDYMTTTDFTDEENYKYACSLIDIQSFIDYFATEIYIGRYGDWPGGNFALWRTREIENEEYGDGKWRWMLYDVYSESLETEIVDMDTLGNTMSNSAIFRNLCRNDDFIKQFVITFMDLANTCFREENVDNTISNYMSLLAKPMEVHFKRFFGADDNTQFVNEVKDVKFFLDNRKPYAEKFLKENFGLTGRPALVEIEINNTDAGSVVINTAEIKFDSNLKWDGVYYTDYPIWISARAKPGYRFVRWEGSIMSDKESLEVELDEEGVVLRAIFEEID